MKHSEYTELTKALESLTKGADTLRVVFSTLEVPADPNTEEPGGQTRVPTDQAKGHQSFPVRFQLLGFAERTVEATARLMDKCVDRWTDTNQDRADHKLDPTADTVALVKTMERFMSATDTPTMGIVPLYDPARTRCHAWIDQANEWFPNLNGTREAPTDPRPTSTPAIDREKLAELFNGAFKSMDPKTLLRPFDLFCNWLETNRPTFCKTELLRVAKQVWESKDVTTKSWRERPFCSFARYFLADCCNVPRDSIKVDGPARYKKTGPTDCSGFLYNPKVIR